MVDLVWPKPNEPSIYVVFGYVEKSSSTSEAPLTLVIPIRAGGSNRIRLQDDETRLLLQGKSRSYSGGTAVDHIKLDGQICIDSDPVRADREREFWRFHSTGSLVGMQTTSGISNTGVRTHPSTDATDHADCLWKLGTRLFRRASYTTDSSYPNHYKPGSVLKGNLFGFARSGKQSWAWDRAFAEDRVQITIEWDLEPASKQLRIKMLWKYQSSKGWIPNVQTRYCIDRPESEAYGTGEGEIVLNFSDELAESMRFGRRDEPIDCSPTDFYSGTLKLPGIGKYKNQRGEWVNVNNSSNKLLGGFTVFISDGPDWWQTGFIRPKAYLTELMDRWKQQASFDYGTQSFVPGIYDNDNFNAGRIEWGLDRGGQTIWTTLQSQAVQNNKLLDTDFVDYIVDMLELRESIVNLSDQFRKDKIAIQNNLPKDLRNVTWDQLTKEGSNTFLPLHWGYNLTIQSAMEIGEQLDRCWSDVRLATEDRYLGPTRATERFLQLYFFGDISGTRTYAWQATVRPEPNGFSEAFAFLEERSVYPTAQSVWNRVPYSFVIDWFTGAFSNACKAIDLQAWKANYNLLECFRSVKYVVKVRPGKVFYPELMFSDPNSELEMTYYHRVWNRKFDPQPLFTTGSGFSILHTIEAGALIVQRL